VPLPRRKPTPDPAADPLRFTDALKSWRERLPFLLDSEIEALAEAAEAQGLTAAVAAQADLVLQVWDAIDSAVANGTTLETFAEQVGQQLAESWGGAVPGQIETVFRTNTATAYNGGRYRMMQRPAVKEARPYWRFDGVPDSRQSSICKPLQGTVKPADSSWWQSHYPPLHHRCRSVPTPLSTEEAHDEGITEEAPRVEVSDGFGAPPAPEDEWAPDLSRYPEPLRAVVKERLGK
jgi:SPP1 gp7 family putative phage head morphogenesis protein